MAWLIAVLVVVTAATAALARIPTRESGAPKKMGLALLFVALTILDLYVSPLL